jgi:hypothetical protein
MQEEPTMTSAKDPDEGDSAMDPEPFQQYIRDLDHKIDQTPDAPPSAPPVERSPAPGRQLGELGAESTSRGGSAAVRKFAKTPPGRLILICGAAFAAALAFGFFVVHGHNTKVHDHVIMINSGAKDSIDCNNGNVKLDGDNNTYTITGHCRRLEIMGSANHVAVDSVDTISILGDDNALTYRSGAPIINKTGNNNVVVQKAR